MKKNFRRILFVIVGGFILLVVLEAGVYNWRLLLSMRHKNLTEIRRQLRWRRDELLFERALLLSPERLEDIGADLGMAPIPLEHFSIVELEPDTEGDELFVCMEQ